MRLRHRHSLFSAPNQRRHQAGGITREAGPPARGGPAAPSREGRTTFTAMRDPYLTGLSFDCSSVEIRPQPERAELPGRRLRHRLRFPAAISNASIATCQAMVSSSDWGNFKICRRASSRVSSVLPSGKTIGRSSRSFQGTKPPRVEHPRNKTRGGALVPDSVLRGAPLLAPCPPCCRCRIDARTSAEGGAGQRRLLRTVRSCPDQPSGNRERHVRTRCCWRRQAKSRTAGW